MASRPLQPSEYEIQREVEALKDLRRRSSTPGALTLDPDLPNQSPPASPTAQYWSTKSPSLLPSIPDNDSIGSSGEGSSSSDRTSNEGVVQGEGTNNPSDDPFHLFWVPASLHPEIAPAEFRAFLKEHARAPPSPDDPIPSDRSTPSPLTPSGSLGRKRSMLSRQYKPKENDGVEEENIVPLKRNRSLMYPTNQGPQLSFNDLQKLEELAEEASVSDDPSRLRSVLRRSLSLNISPTELAQMGEVPDMGDEADAPIIVPPPGQILRRAARTKIRKPGLPGDGGGHRFGASRRGAKPAQAGEPRTSSDMSSSDHGEVEPSPVTLRRPTLTDESQPRPESFSEEASIFDAYARDEEDEAAFTPVLVTPHPEDHTFLPLEEPVQLPPLQLPSEVKPSQPEAVPVLHQPQPQRLTVPQAAPDQGPPSRTPSPSDQRPSPSHTPPFLQSPPQSRKEKEKDKKGLFGKWGGDKGGKKGAKEKERSENRDRAAAEKDSGFFGSLFGKKKQESEYQSSITGGTSGRETAQALLGASKSSKSYVPPTSPGLAPGIGGNPYARYPIHVERAIYRLSHIKLANPRRPLYEQVLISNLMFWYLGVINKAQNPSPSPTQTTTNGAPTAGESDAEKEEREREQREKEQRENAERERSERERQEKEQREREIEMKKKESGRRGSLTKTPVGGQPGGRRAEMPVKGPQYEMQHRVMEQEYGGYNGQPPRSPTSSRTPMNGVPGQPYQQRPPQPYEPQPKIPPEQYYYQSQMENPHPQQRPGLPPGAMAPVDHSGWMSQSNGPPQQRHPSSGPPLSGPQRRSQSPPARIHPQHGQPLHKASSQENLGGGGPRNGPSRSLSASASPPPFQPNGNVLRKGNSAHAASPPYDRRPSAGDSRPKSAGGEEEDVPLAVWQQQRRK